ncbi:hypothetical protein EGW08_001798 [Elysia chlorotica]|uniref:C3H1-type domain-containing protein n=1 Tax=Elysia chlorotica TaxID=188477 RepID=A0A3S1I1M1_ELYCH|nr:hypothetical protein EGW08_001798 [Elysia chlorotica]
MASCVVTISNSSHEQPGHELKRIKAGLEVLLGVKCQFSISKAFDEIGKTNIDYNATNNNSGTPSLNKTKTSGNGQKISQVKQIQNHGKVLVLKISFETDLSSENISRAQKFVLSHLSSAPAYIVNHCCLATQREFDMVVRSASSIQSESSALLTFDRDTKEISIQGSESSVKCARTQIGKIIDSLTEHRGWSDSITPDMGVYYGQKETAQTTEVCKEDPKQNEDVLLKLISDSKCVKPAPSTEYKVTEAAVPSNLKQTLGKKVSQDKYELYLSENAYDRDSSFSSSGDELDDKEEDILLDKKYSKLVETGLKLGYSEENVKKAILKLGQGCDSNNLLSELINITKAETEPPKVTDTDQEGDTTCSSIISTDGFMSHESSRMDHEISLSPKGSLVSPDTTKPPIDPSDSNNLRHIIIDGSNVAMSHGKDSFSCRGIKIAVDWFKARGHKYITAFVPKWRKESSRPDALITDQELLNELEKDNVLVFTPARRVKGRRVVCYDDRFILKLAEETGGIVVSNDVYRDLVNERETYRQVVDQRLLMYTFVGDRFMPPEDPLGRSGPTLDNFLRKVPIDPRPRPQDCPFGKKCTYGNKCRFYHPERGFGHQKLVSEKLKEQADAKLQERANKIEQASHNDREKGRRPKQLLTRTKSLIPGALLSSRNYGELSGKSSSRSEKPKLTHSTSLNLSTSSKSSDYLDNARKKFEEAELLSATEQLSLELKPSELKSFPSEELHDLSHLKAEGMHGSRLSPADDNSQSSSPTFPSDITAWQPSPSMAQFSVISSSGVQQSGLTVDAPTATSAVSTKSRPRKASPSHLPVPKQSEPYVSGHLELAQKLSDEGSDSNFFSERTSSKSASSTPRTISPVVPPLNSSGQKRRTSKSSSKKSSTEDSAEQSKLRQQLYVQTPVSSQACFSETTNFLAGIPNLSIFNEHQSLQPMSHQTSVEPQTCANPAEENLFQHVSSVTEHHQHSSFAQSADMFRSQHSGVSHNPSNPLEQSFTIQNDRIGTEYQVNPYEHKHMPLKPQSSVPIVGGQQTYLGSQTWNVPPVGLSRQNSTSDPQLHISAGQQQSFSTSNGSNPPVGGHMVHSLSGPANPQQQSSVHAYKQIGPQPTFYSSNEQGIPNVLYQNDLYNNPYLGNRGELQSSYESSLYSHPQKFQEQQQQQQQHSFSMKQTSSLGLNQFSPLNSRVGDGRFSMQLPPSPGSLNYQQQHLLLSQCPQVPQYGGAPHSTEGFHGMQQTLLSPTTSYTGPTADFPPSFHQPPPNFLPPPPMMQHYSNPPPPPLYYSMQSPVPQGRAGYASPVSYSPVGPSVTQVPAEDLPIPTNDPRHALYGHLSTVFLETVVRKVMNRYPHLTKFDDIVNKILEYVNKGEL